MDPIHVLLATDRRCLWGCAVSMRSLLAHAGPDREVSFHVLVDGLTPQDMWALRNTVETERARTSIRFASFDATPVRSLVRSKHITRAVYARLFLGEVLPPDVERCVYIDCDVLFERDVAELWSSDLEGHVLGAVDNGLWDDPAAYQRRLGLRHPAYFNSGILLVDVAKWRSEDLGGRAIAFAREAGDRLVLFDQDALNGALDGAWRRLPVHWNLWVIHPSLHDDARAVFHFMGPKKPWHPDYDGPFRDKFFQHLDRTAFAGARPWNPAGLGGALKSARRRIPYLPSVLRMARLRTRREPKPTSP